DKIGDPGADCEITILKEAGQVSGLSSCYDFLVFLNLLIKETIPQTMNSKTPKTMTAFIIEKLTKAISPSLSYHEKAYLLKEPVCYSN
ncbi:hypothetical protein P8865_00005, partial [Bacillus haynesii]|nr:hypothetical protein [Bacillus haynesii]